MLCVEGNIIEDVLIFFTGADRVPPLVSVNHLPLPSWWIQQANLQQQVRVIFSCVFLQDMAVASMLLWKEWYPLRRMMGFGGV